MNLTSDIVEELLCPEHVSYSFSEEFQIWCVDASLDSGVSCTIFGIL